MRMTTKRSLSEAIQESGRIFTGLDFPMHQNRIQFAVETRKINRKNIHSEADLQIHPERTAKKSKRKIPNVFLVAAIKKSGKGASDE